MIINNERKRMAIVDLNGAIAYLNQARDELVQDNKECLDSIQRAFNELESALLNIKAYRKEVRSHGSIN